MLKAVIFDCDGVLADSEPVHLKAFQAVLLEEGVTLTDEDYHSKYLAYDDKTCFFTALRDNGKSFDKTVIESMMARKSKFYDKLINDHIFIFPGVKGFVDMVSQKYALAIGSGALRKEIEFITAYAGIQDKLNIIVSADEVENCKPDPEVYNKALQRINQLHSSRIGKVAPSECLVVEDSIVGVRAAHAAGMKCLAVTTSYNADELSHADMVVDGLEDVRIEDLESLFQ